MTADSITKLAEKSGQSFEQLCEKADGLRDGIFRLIEGAEASIDAASPDAEDYCRHLRRIANTLDDVSTVKLMTLALLNEDLEGLLLVRTEFALWPERIAEYPDAVALLATHDEEAGEFIRKIGGELN